MKKRIAHSAVAILLALPVAHASSGAHAPAKIRHTVVAVSGAPAPAGGTYTRSFGSVAVNAWSQVAFDAGLLGPSTSGVFVWEGGRTSTIALGGNQDPADGDFSIVGNPFITRRGRVVFDVNFTDTFRSKRGTAIPLARTGGPAPGGGTLSPFAGAHEVNTRGGIAYAARVLDGPASEGIFRANARGTVAIAREGDAAPSGGTFSLFSLPAINDRGQVAFFAEVSGGTAGFGVFLGDGHDLTPVFVANQIAPDGSTFQDFSDPRINRHGQVAVSALLANGPVANGLFLATGTGAVTIALEGQAAPKGGSYSGAFARPLTLNDRGELAFNVGLRGGTSARGIFRGNGRRTTTLALTGTIAPGTTGTFQSFRDMKLGSDGRVAFIATLAVGLGGVDQSNNVGIWVGTSDADLRLVVRTGDVIGGRVLTRLPTSGQFDINGDAIVWIGQLASTEAAVVLSRIPGKESDGHDGGGSSR